MPETEPKIPRIFIPENFDPNPLVNNAVSRADGKNNLIDAMLYTLHLIADGETSKDKQDSLLKDGYITLNAKTLKDICGDHYKTAIELLEHHGVISVRKSFTIGKKSKGYCIIGAYSGAKLKEAFLQPTGGVFRRLAAWYQEKEKKNQEKLTNISYVIKWLDADHLKMNVKEAHALLEFYRYSMAKRIQATIDNPLAANIENRINRRFNAAMTMIEHVQNGNFRPYRMGKDNRLHTAITSLMKEFRSFLTYDGEPLVGVDIKSSQPYLFNLLFDPATYESAGVLSIKNLYPELYQDISNPSIHRSIYDIIMIRTYGPKRAVSSGSFLEVDWSKDFYQHLVDGESHFVDKPKVFTTRNDAKQLIMFAFYNTKTRKYSYPNWKRFEALYPIEARLIKVFDFLSRSAKRAYLPILLQRLESVLMLDIICKEISTQCPNAPLIPIHDSIFTTQKHLQVVEEIMQINLLKYLGVKPGLKKELCSADDVKKNLENMAALDYDEIVVNVHNQEDMYVVDRKKPLLNEMPSLFDKRILSTIYLDSDRAS